MSIPIIEFAIILLVGHLVAACFILTVLLRQARLLRVPIERYYHNFRIGLFALSCIIFLGNMVPIAIDGITLFTTTQRPDRLYTISIVYAMSNVLTALTSAITIWLLYRISANSNRS